MNNKIRMVSGTIGLFVAALAAMTSCANGVQSGVSEESSTTINVTTEPSTVETTEPEEKTETTVTEIPKEVKLNSKYYGNYFSIGISDSCKISNSKYGIATSLNDSDNGVTIQIVETKKEEGSYTHEEDYINKQRKPNDEVYTNEKSIQFIRRIDEKGGETFFFYNEKSSSIVSFKWGYGNDEKVITAIMNSVEYTDRAVDNSKASEEQNIENTDTTKKATEPPVEKVKETDPPESMISKGQEEALSSAKNYIKLMDFSYDGLIKQLEFENYSHDDAVYGADNCGADWDSEALGAAKSYVSMSGFSYDGLIKQLEFEKYTHDQAVYGADNCGADWNSEAAEAAAAYINIMSMSRESLINQLVYEGFTQEQAEIGASSVGY